jgi:Helicase conserved C-terminal domain/Type III restriction enzyme, res subunit
MIRELRPHQLEAKLLAQQIADKGPAWPHKISSFHVTPGGGKTLGASVFAHALVRGGVADYVLYVCPRDTLRQQVVGAWTSAPMDLPGGLKSIRGAPTAQPSLLREDRMGFVTTYQSIAKHPNRFLKLMQLGKWLLVLDEGHHLPESGQAFEDDESRTESGWTQHIRPLVEAAAHILIMTGSAARDKGKIAFLRHEGRRAIYDVTHTRRSALACRSVLHVITKLCDGTSKYWYRLKPHTAELSADNGKESGHVLETALLDPVYRDALLSDAIADWENYRHHNTRARMIVVCMDIPKCRQVVRYIKDHHPRWVPVLAVSKTVDKEQSGKRALSKFRDHQEGHILVTCQMAYEGLDVPDCTHLVCLTNIRSRSWLEQAFARVTRFDPDCGLSWEEQCAYIYAPADPDMVRFLSEWLDEQDGSFVEPKPRVGVIGIGARRSSFDPDGCEPGSVSYGDTNGRLPDEDQARIHMFREQFPAETRRLPPESWIRLARAMWPDIKRTTGT